MKLLWMPVLALCLVLSGCRQDKAESPKIELKSASLKDIEGDIAGHKGKIVVMDLWGVWCPPCKAEFHNLVNMHHNYDKDGVVCLSLCLTNGSDDKSERPNAEKFLNAKGAVFTNYWLEEKDKGAFDAAQDRWNIKGIPVVVVYGRDGKLAKTFTRDDDNQFTYEDVEKLVKKMIKG